MAFRNPLMPTDVEPYEESQGAEPPSPVSPDELKAFYSDMEKQDLQRKLSRSKPGSRSLWSRKSSKKKSPSADPVLHNPQPSQPAQQQPPQQPQQQNEMGMMEEKSPPFETADKFNHHLAPPNMTSRSVIPDALVGSPVMHIKEIHGSIPLPVHKGRHPIHNPIGPRWYKNHHLIPPAQLRLASQSLSFFSPSFPPIPPFSHERIEDQSRISGLSRTPSGSPLPTPTSSQTMVADNGGRTRSRKTSQTTPDNVDLLDVTDPCGTNWHHQSPYDVGLNAGPNGLDSDVSRSRTAPAPAPLPPARHKSVVPSPLSQSTSGVHLQPSNHHVPQDTHKLLKPRKVVPDTSLNNRVNDSNPKAPQSTSLPPSPSKASVHNGGGFVAGAPYSAMSGPGYRKERRTSLLGRLAKKFSLLRKPNRNTDDDDRHHIDGQEVKRDTFIRSKHASMANISTQAEQTVDPRPRSLIIPSLPPHRTAPNSEPRTSQSRERLPSLASLDEPISLGRLTIANPDEPSREDDTTTVLHDAPSSTVQPDSEPKISVPPKDEPSRSSQPPHPQGNSFHELDHSPLSLPPRLPSLYPGSPLTVPTIPSEIDLPLPPSAANVTQDTSHSSSGTPRANRSPTKPRRPGESVIPFPGSLNDSLPEIPSLLSPPPRAPAFLPLVADSPLSTASMFVNPPTPHIPETPIPNNIHEPEAPPPPPRPPLQTKRSSQERQGNGVTRQTEAFKLIRSSTDDSETTGEKIVAAGEQWEVVESDVPRRRTRDKSSKHKERESGSRREHRRSDKAKNDLVDPSGSHRKMSQTKRRSANGRPTESSSTPTSAQRQSMEHGRHSTSSSANHEEQRQSRKREEERTSDRKRRSAETRPNDAPNVDKPQPAPPQPAPGAPLLERRPSLTARPTSELPSSAELNAMRARDAWDMERLWKGRSMYEADPSVVASSSAPATENPHSSQAYPASKDPMMTSIYGSSHTSYVVHPLYQGGPTPYTNAYYAVPGSAPMAYASPPTHGFQYQGFYVPALTPSYVPSPDISALSSSSNRGPLSNPLPVPPRESSYMPTPIPPIHTLSDPNARSSDFWDKNSSTQ